MIYNIKNIIFPKRQKREELLLKKIFRIFVLLFLVAAFVGCGTTTTTEAPTTNAPTTVAPTTAAPTTAPDVDTEPVLSGAEDIVVPLGHEFDFLVGIKAMDDVDGDITDSIVVDSSSYNKDTAGEYTINLTVTDSFGHEVTDSYTITVKDTLSLEEKANLDIRYIGLDYPNLKLPKFGNNGTYFYWSSNNPRVITANGFVINPSVGSEPVDVTLSLRAVNSTVTINKEFVFTVEPNPEVTVTKKVQLDFEGTSEEYVVADKQDIDVYYVDNGSVPYMNVRTFLEMLDGAIVPSLFQYSNPEEDVLRIDYTYTYTDLDGVTEVTENYYAIIDFTENTFTVNNFDFFAGYIAETESDYGEGLNYVDTDFVDGQEVVIPLGEYNFDLVIYEEGGYEFYLMPLHILNRLFMSDIYYDVYYNGDKLWGIDTFFISSGSNPALITEIQTSSLNSQTAPKDMKLATYNFLALTFDYFYGLKPDKGYETYYETLYAYAEMIICGTDNDLYNRIFRITYGLDDLHTSYQFDGYWQNPRVPGVSLTDLGPKTNAFYEAMWAVEDLLDAKYGSAASMPDWETIDDEKTIAVIHLTGFTIDTPDDFKAILDSLPSTVTDVVVDLSYNTGGNIGAVMRIFGYMTEEQFTYHSQNPADGSAVTYYIESDYVAYDYNWYVLTSKVTFSAANMFASMAKELGIPIIGQKSSGGACSIGVIVNPDGSVIMISTNNVLSSRSGDETSGYVYTSVENGVPVDYSMSDVTSDSQLINIIKNIKASS